MKKEKNILINSIEELTLVVEKHDVKLALEPIYNAENSSVNTIPETLEIISEVNSSRFGLFFDVYHQWQDKNLLDHIKDTSKIIYGVHISDWKGPSKSMNVRVLMGQGIIPLKKILQFINDCGCDGFYDVEIFL